MSIQIGSGNTPSSQFQTTTTQRLILKSQFDSNVINLSSATAACTIMCDQINFGRRDNSFQLSHAAVPLLTAQSNVGMMMFCPFTASNVAKFNSNVTVMMDLTTSSLNATSAAIRSAIPINSQDTTYFGVTRNDGVPMLRGYSGGLVNVNTALGIGTTFMYTPDTLLHVESNAYISNRLTTTTVYLNTINDRTGGSTITMLPSGIELKASLTTINGDFKVLGKFNFDTGSVFNAGATVKQDFTTENINIQQSSTVNTPLFNMVYGGSIDGYTSNIYSMVYRPADSNIQVMAIDNRGRVGFGSGRPSALIDVAVTSNHNAPFNFRIKDQINSANNFAIDAGANVGIGTDVPVNRLSISYFDNIPPTRYLAGCNYVPGPSSNVPGTSNAIWGFCNYRGTSNAIISLANYEVYNFPNRPFLVASCNDQQLFQVSSGGQITIGTSNINSEYAIDVAPSMMSRIPKVQMSTLYGDQANNNTINGSMTVLDNMGTVNTSNSYIGNLNTSNIYTKYIYAESYEILTMRCLESSPSLFEVLVDNFQFIGESIIFSSNFDDRPTNPITGGKLKIMCENAPIGSLSRGIAVVGNLDTAISVQSVQSAPYYELVTQNNKAQLGMLLNGTVALSQSADFAANATPKFRIFNSYSVGNTTYSAGAISAMQNVLITNAGININQLSPSFTRALQVGGDCLFANNTSPVMFINGSSPTARRVGICTDTPLYNLDVQGTQFVSGTTYLNGNVGIGTAPTTDICRITNTGMNASLCIQNIVSGSNVTVDSRGYVGIGTTPRFSIDISGDINFTGRIYKGAVPYIESQWTTNAASNIYILHNVGIGTLLPSYGLEVRNYDVFFGCNLSVGSNLTCFGTVYSKGSFVTTSDRAIKVNLEPIPAALDKVARLTGYTYDRTDTRRREAGLIAQEVMEVLPEVVNTSEPLMSIAYGNIASIFVEAIKELKNKVASLETEVQRLKQQLG